MVEQRRDDPGREGLVAAYTRFGRTEARANSPIYERLSEEVAASSPLIDYLLELPEARRQPNLFFAAARLVAGADPVSAGQLEDLVRNDGLQIHRLMLNRTTQTNEPARCAVLLPILARIDGPVALLEVGASAGLCLLPDCYGYSYGKHLLHPADPTHGAFFNCKAGEGVPIPARLPQVVWRRGLDLNPLSVHNVEDIAWLEALIWPGQAERLERFRGAVKVARRLNPDVHRGDLLHDLEVLAASAPVGATLVIYHSAVLTYVQQQAARDRFASQAMELADVWISNEAAGVFPEIAVTLDGPPRSGQFLLAMNRRPTAWTGPHGQSIDWIADPADEEVKFTS
ncbi:MAG: DUF2332 domain-containing protein [Pseudomonadota bacterium]